MKTLFLIRGLPGSGKSTLALQLSECVYEADDFFLCGDGTYRFDAEWLGAAHERCRENTKYAMMDGLPRIAVSNTFTKRWEMEPYIKLAEEYDYQVVEITMSGPLHANIHNVPEETIQRMRERWER